MDTSIVMSGGIVETDTGSSHSITAPQIVAVNIV